MFDLPGFDSNEELILCKSNGDILPLEELRIRIFLLAYRHHDECAATAASYLQIKLDFIYSFKENLPEAYAEKYEEDAIDEAYKIFAQVDSKPSTSIFFKRINFFDEENNFRPLVLIEKDIAHIAIERYRVRSLAARRLGIEESALNALLEKADVMEGSSLIDLVKHNLKCKMSNKLSEEKISNEFNPHGLNLFNPDGHIRSIEEIEKAHIEAAIVRYRGRMTEVAERLDIGRSTLYRKLKEYGLPKPSEAAP